MKNNVILYKDPVYLVPYSKAHVPIYHAWLKDPFLQQVTASEPLSLEEEYVMQQDWRDDPKSKKIIFL
jgi:hypothetical protein